MPMISDSNPRWRAVRLQNEQSVRYLERLLRAGWYLMRLDVDGLSTRSFSVPLKPPPPMPSRLKVYATPPDNLSVIVLCKGKVKGRQQVVAIFRDESGRLDLTSRQSPGPEWEVIEMVWTENLGSVFFYEKIGESAEG